MMALFLDFYKAFDTVEHSFIFQASFYVFGETFSNLIKSFYKNTNSSVSLTYGTSPRVEVKRGIKRGCPILASLFIMAVELLYSESSSTRINQRFLSDIWTET